MRHLALLLELCGGIIIGCSIYISWSHYTRYHDKVHGREEEKGNRLEQSPIRPRLTVPCDALRLTHAMPRYAVPQNAEYPY